MSMADDNTTWRNSAAAPAEENLGLAIHMLLPGWKVFGRFTLETQAGQGAMSVVWRAHDELLDEIVALKFLAEVVARDAVAVDDLRQKTARARWLAHPHIVRVNDFMRDNTLATVSMEYVGGATLAQRRLEQPGRVFSAAALAPLIGQLCPALDYAHQVARTVHHSLKPSNILVTPEGVAKITDFGIGSSLAGARLRLLGRTERVHRSMFYMSPQQLEDAPPRPADDIYAFGAVLYELLAGEPPFSNCDVVAQIRTREPVPMAERRAASGVTGDPIPPMWEEAVVACLAKDPAQRPSSGEEIMYLLGLAGRNSVTEERSPVQDTVQVRDSAAQSSGAPATPAPPTRPPEGSRPLQKRSLIHYPTPGEAEREAEEQELAAQPRAGEKKERSWVIRAWTEFLRY